VQGRGEAGGAAVRTTSTAGTRPDAGVPTSNAGPQGVVGQCSARSGEDRPAWRRLDPARLAQATAPLREAIEAGELPGAVLLVGTRAETLLAVALGVAQLHPPGARRPMEIGTPFDLASLTKVVATMPAVLRLVAMGELDLDAPVSRYLPGVAPEARGILTLRHLLTHTGGLPATFDGGSEERSPDQLLAAIVALAPSSPPGSLVRYSDCGFILLGAVVEAVVGLRLDQAFEELVSRPGGLEGACFCPTGTLEAAAAATEPDRSGRSLVGRVHDETAAALGGRAGHAGLFAEAADVARSVQSWAIPTDLLPAQLREEALRLQTPTLEGRRGLGWVCRGDPYDCLGPLWPPTAVSHTGFTGTSIALDPSSGIWVVLLTNAVHLGRGRSPIVALRRKVHTEVALAVEGSTRSGKISPGGIGA